MYYSIIIPVYNRPDEINECLKSLESQTFNNFEIVIIEDGSDQKCDLIVDTFKQKLNIKYFYKKNSVPGFSRNFGAKKAEGEYLIFCDSDCIIPSKYFEEIDNCLKKKYTDFFGGPDKAHQSFTDLQKAINYAMTSLLTTGGVRGSKSYASNFQPRSFNMGISKSAFQDVGGFGVIHPGEDPDLTIRLWNLGYKSQYIHNAYVFHKRRISWMRFYRQVYKFGICRPILNIWHPQTSKLTYWFPSGFILGFTAGIFSQIFYKNSFILALFLIYLSLVLVHSCAKNKSINIALLSLVAVFIQFIGYGTGFLKSNILIRIFRKKPEHVFPFLFFKD